MVSTRSMLKRAGAVGFKPMQMSQMPRGNSTKTTRTKKYFLRSNSAPNGNANAPKTITNSILKQSNSKMMSSKQNSQDKSGSKIVPSPKRPTKVSITGSVGDKQYNTGLPKKILKNTAQAGKTQLRSANKKHVRFSVESKPLKSALKQRTNEKASSESARTEKHVHFNGYYEPDHEENNTYEQEIPRITFEEIVCDYLHLYVREGEEVRMSTFTAFLFVCLMTVILYGCLHIINMPCKKFLYYLFFGNADKLETTKSSILSLIKVPKFQFLRFFCGKDLRRQYNLLPNLNFGRANIDDLQPAFDIALVVFEKFVARNVAATFMEKVKFAVDLAQFICTKSRDLPVRVPNYYTYSRALVFLSKCALKLSSDGIFKKFAQLLLHMAANAFSSAYRVNYANSVK